MKKCILKEIIWPDFGKDALPVSFSADELTARVNQTREMMERYQLTHLIIYADKEHFANLKYLLNYEPKFEEAVLVLDLKNDPLILMGNECVNRFKASPLFQINKLRTERFQPFSLLNQPKDESRLMKEIFASEGIKSGSKVGCAGWKYFSEKEHPSAEYAIEIPAYIVDTLREIAGFDQVVNATHLFMHPDHGLRSRCTVSEIAFFEFSGIMSSEGMKNLLHNIKPGQTDFELVRNYNYTGYPLSCHIGMTCGANRHIGLAHPEGYIIKKGDPLSTNIGYWGSLNCRAGWVAESENDLPEEAKGYVENFAAPFYSVMGEWFKNLKIGTKGKKIASIIDDNLPFDTFGIFLNPGHLSHYDEWLSSPIYKGSESYLESGMYVQVDVIPKSAKYFSTRMEDGVVLADKTLREELKLRFPSVYERCINRRKFMMDVLAIELPDELLPISNIPGIVPPFFLKPELIFALEK